VFTGIVQAVGTVASWKEGVLHVIPNGLNISGLQMGESIAVNGVCLTVVSFDEGQLRFDLSPETVQVTAFACLTQEASVNLERAMALGDRLGGHIVQGHVDTVGTFLGSHADGNSHVFRFEVSDPQYLIPKGSITLNGISLTIVNPKEREFEVWVIPHTLENTNLSNMIIGDKINVEYDVLAKYIEKLTQFYVNTNPRN
jgi:riboflavin synthase